MIARLPYDELPVTLTAELAAGGTRPRAGARDGRGRLRGGPARTAASTSPAPRSPASWSARVASSPASPAWSPGLAIAELAFVYAMGDGVEMTDRVPDGTRVEAGDTVLRVAGLLQDLLTAERTALNFACHLSGVATATSHWVSRARGHPRPGARHPQDAARLARAAEVRRALRRRGQPPVQPQRPRDGQGQPRRRRGRRRPGVPGRRRGQPRPARRGRGDRPRPAARAPGGRLHRDPARQHGLHRRWPRRSSSPRAARPSRPRAG